VDCAKLRVLVVGGGPAGLGAAIALRRAGVAVELVEETSWHLPGAELFVAGATLRALDQLGVADRCVSAGVGVSELHYCDDSGAVEHVVRQPVIARTELPPTLTINRRALHEVLSTEVVALGAHVTLGVSVEHIDPTDEGARIRFTDGRTDDFDLVLGADGVDSTVRRLMFPEVERAQPAGQWIWRIRLPRAVDLDTVMLYYGPRNKVVAMPVSDDDMYLILTAPDAGRERVPEGGWLAEVTDQLAGYGGHIAAARDAIGVDTEIQHHRLRSMFFEPPWYRGRVLLVGDAAHATPPQVGFGVGLALEDAVVLTECLRSADSMEDALAGFCARRYERCRMVVHTGRTLCGQELLRWTTPDGQAAVDANADVSTLPERTWNALAQPA
jgi:2-polyprenyl-6-methoxyphenol hydroxylase-like FAD-dependent oxidoreductase